MPDENPKHQNSIQVHQPTKFWSFRIKSSVCYTIQNVYKTSNHSCLHVIRHPALDIYAARAQRTRDKKTNQPSPLRKSPVSPPLDSATLSVWTQMWMFALWILVFRLHRKCFYLWMTNNTPAKLQIWPRSFCWFLTFQEPYFSSSTIWDVSVD